MKFTIGSCGISFAVAVLLWAIHPVKGSSACRTLNFDLKMTGKRLVNHMIDIKQASSDDWCMLFCLWDNNCMSINFNQTKDSDGMHLCELNNSDEGQHPENLKDEKEFSYHGTKNPCFNNPCKRNAMCQTGFGCEGYRCVCPTGFSGEACEDIDECATSSPCHANANCTNTPGSYVCNCSTGYQGNGSHCEEVSRCRDGNPCDVDFLFPEQGVTDYVTCPNCTVPSLQAFTVCFWMRTNDTESKGTPFNYFVAENEIWIYDYNKFALYMQTKNRRSSVSATDGAWHHICFTWESIAGSWQIYKDGVLNASGQELQKDHVIPGGGLVILGQDQDGRQGGGFQRSQSFVGSLSRVNLWDHVISSDEISRMSKACTAELEGNVIKWSDFMSGIRGNVKIINPSSCKP